MESELLESPPFNRVYYAGLKAFSILHYTCGSRLFLCPVRLLVRSVSFQVTQVGSKPIQGTTLFL